MPPNKRSGSELLLNPVEYRFKQVANPYNEAKNACFEDCPGTSGSGGTGEQDYEEPEQQLTEDTVRVTTRARLTYELYNYSKNSMLIVHGASTSASEVNELKTTFENFRFEVEDFSFGSNNVEVYDICGQFFQRDFTDFGAVALVVLNPLTNINNGPFPALENRFIDESVIMDNFKPELNPTLADKPKIYINEASRGRLMTSLYTHFNDLDLPLYPNLIGFSTVLDTKSAYYQSKKQNPGEIFKGALSLLCKKITAMGDSVNFTEIIVQTINDSREKISPSNPIYNNMFKSPYGVVSTLTKELYFARVEENQ